MEKLINHVKTLVGVELERANTIHLPYFNSYHEAYAVILEEIEEAEIELKRVRERAAWAWHHIKLDLAEETDIGLKAAEEYAINAAAEMIQVAAMCRKARRRDD